MPGFLPTPATRTSEPAEDSQAADIIEYRLDRFKAWHDLCARMDWPDERRTGHLQKWYCGRQGKDLDLRTPDNMIFLNVLSPQQREDAVAEMNMRWELADLVVSDRKLLNLRYEVLVAAVGKKKPKIPGPDAVINLINDPARVADIWVLMQSMMTENDLKEYLVSLAQDEVVA
jgi:hypothetical protein